MTKRKPAKPRKRADSFDSPDGQTQSCAACRAYSQEDHTCHLRPMTEEERALVEAVLAWYADRNAWMKAYRILSVKSACRAVLESRKDPT